MSGRCLCSNMKPPERPILNSSSKDVRFVCAAKHDASFSSSGNPSADALSDTCVPCFLPVPDSDWGGDELLCEDGASPGEDHCDGRLLLLQPPPPQDRALSGSVALGGIGGYLAAALSDTEAH